MYPKLSVKKDYFSSITKIIFEYINYLSNTSKCFLMGNDNLWIFMKKSFHI